MGKIIRNGINYGGTYEDATSVNYDNSASGLEARTVQEAVDEVVENLENSKIGFIGSLIKNLTYEECCVTGADALMDNYYIATENCWIMYSFNIKADSFYRINVNGVTITADSIHERNKYSSHFIPLKKGQKICFQFSEEPHEFLCRLLRME